MVEQADDFIDDEWKKRIQKPIGVYVCTTIIFIRFGIINFINYFSLFRSIDGEVALPIVAITLGLSLFTAAAAIWTLIGHNEGRVALLILLPLNIFWVLLFDAAALLNNEKTDDEAAVFSIIQQVFISLFVVGIEWYFMSRNVIRYYKQNG